MATTIDPTKSAISTSALSTPQTPIIPINPAYDVNGYTTGANQSGAYIASTLQNAQNEAQTSVDLQKSNLANETSSMATLASQLNGQGTGLRSSTIDQANQMTGATEKLNLLNRINAEAQGLQYKRDVIPLELQRESVGRGRTDAGLAPLETAALRDNAIALSSKAYEAAIASADYNAAQNESNKLVNLKYDGVIAEINAKKANIENIRGNLTEAQKKVADAQTRLLDKQKQDELDKKAAEKAVSDMLIEASPVAPPDVMARAKAVQAKGGSAMEVATALGKYGGDYLAREKIKAEIAKMDADAIKTRADAAKTRAETTGGGTGTTGTASDNAKAWLAQYNSGTMSLEDIYTKIGSSKEASVLKNEVARLIAAQGGKRVFGLDDASIQAINAQIKNVDDLLYGNGKKEIDKTTGDVGSIVGFVQGGLGVIPDSWNTGKQDALAVAKNLVSNQTLQALADAKAKGITFGALSEGELGLVADAASRISAKLKIDPKTKEIIGFTGSESQFKEDLKTIRDNLAKSIETKTQSKQSNVSKEESTADDIMTANKKIQSEINSGYNVFDN